MADKFINAGMGRAARGRGTVGKTLHRGRVLFRRRDDAPGSSYPKVAPNPLNDLNCTKPPDL